MPAPRAVPADLNAVLDETLALYDGLFARIQLERQFATALPPVRLDAEQIRRVVINLVDNAIEALGGTQARRAHRIERRSSSRPARRRNVVRADRVADNGPAFRAADRDKLFMPYYSTKRRGSGLGLAIVRRIVAEHGGTSRSATTCPRHRFDRAAVLIVEGLRLALDSIAATGLDPD